MEVITGGRRSGKTVELIKRSAETGIYILVRDQPRARDLFRLAKQLGYSIPYPVTSEEYFRTEFRGSCIRRDGLYVDNVDEIIQQFLRGIQVKAITVAPTKQLEENKMPLEDDFYHGGRHLIEIPTDKEIVRFLESGMSIVNMYPYVDVKGGEK